MIPESADGTRNYVSGIEYLGANLDAIYHAEGRCTPNGASAFHYEYTLKDHLGNARVNFRANGAAITFLQELHYYPFGMIVEGIGTAKVTDNAYKYNGKELNEDLGLNLSDYGARWYDAALGRWWSVDLLAFSTPTNSGYSYGLNNPLRFIDLFGLTAGDPGYNYDWNRKVYLNKDKEEVSWSEVHNSIRGSAKLTTYVYNGIGEKNFSSNQLSKSLEYAVDIFQKNGLAGVFSFEFIDEARSKQISLTGHHELYIGIIDVSSKIPGNSQMNHLGDVFTMTNTGNSRSWVNLYWARYYSSKNADFALGYLIGHELLHQLLQKATYNLEGESAAIKLLVNEHTNSQINLNMDGPVLETMGAFPRFPSKNLRDSETILPQHYALILRYLFEYSLQK